jgi:hypothetical protein
VASRVKATSSIGPLRPISTTSVADDPIFAAIERHRIAEREYGDILSQQSKMEEELPKHLRQSDIRPLMGVNNVVETDDLRWIVAERKSQEAGEKTAECGRALVETRPTTLEGVKALLRYVTEFIGDDLDVTNGVLANVAKALESNTLDCDPPVEEPQSDVSNADPIFAVLAEHKAATNAYIAASRISGNLADGTPEWVAADEVTRAAIDRDHIATYAVLTAQPTTLAGAVALLEHVGQGQFLEHTEEAEGDEGFETVLSTWAHGDDDNKFTIASKGFVRRLGATMRSLSAS